MSDAAANGSGSAGAAQARGRVGLLCQHFYPEMISTGMHMTELAEGLTALGWKITAYCAQPALSLHGENPRVPTVINHRGIRAVRVPTLGSHRGSLLSRLLNGMSYTFSCLWAVVRDRRKLDGLLISTCPPYIGLVGRVAAALLGLPYIVIQYDVYPDLATKLGVLDPRSPFAWVWERLTRLILNGAGANVVIGRDMEELVKGKMRPDRHGTLALIWNWSDADTVRPLPREENPFIREHGLAGKTVIQYAGRMARYHNTEPLIEAAGLLRDEPVVFQFVGDGAKFETLVGMAQERRLANVQFLPYQPIERLREMLSAADIGVVCHEKFLFGVNVPSKTYGVMASGTPILGLLDPRTEIGRTILENNCGIVIDEATGEQVAAAIRALLADPARLRAMGENGYRAFLANYTLAHAARRYSDLMSRVFPVRAPASAPSTSGASRS